MNEQELSVPYKVVEVEGKGRGLVATRAMDLGYVLLKESPIFAYQPQETGPHNTETHVAQFIQEFKKLSDTEKAKVMSLCEVEGDTENDCKEILTSLVSQGILASLSRTDEALFIALMKKMTSNALGCEGGKTAVFETISMINHSCAPNVFWECKDHETTMEVRACRRIEEGDEIVASYYNFEDFPLRQERQDIISNERSFHCSCKICSLTGEDLEEDENIRKKLQRLDREVGEHFERFDYTSALETAEEELEVMDEHRDLFVLKYLEVLGEVQRLASWAGEAGRKAAYRGRMAALAGLLPSSTRAYYSVEAWDPRGPPLPLN